MKPLRRHAVTAWWALAKDAVSAWTDDHAPSTGPSQRGPQVRKRLRELASHACNRRSGRLECDALGSPLCG